MKCNLEYLYTTSLHSTGGSFYPMMTTKEGETSPAFPPTSVMLAKIAQYGW